MSALTAAVAALDARVADALTNTARQIFDPKETTMTTTEHPTTDEPRRHGVAGGSWGWIACDCGEISRNGDMARHLLDAGRDEGRQEGYDAGLAAAKGERVTIDDRRVKPGARVRVEEIGGHGDMVAREGIVREISLYRNGRVLLSVAGVLIDGATSICLLAEAPDPDAEVRDALASVIGNSDPDTHSDDFLAALRAAGFDVVKAVAK